MPAKFLYLLGVLLFVFGVTRAQMEKDHALHFGAGVASGAVGALVASELSNQNPYWTFTGSVIASLVAGITKEAIDSGQVNNHWSNADLGWTALGGVTVGVTISLVNGKKHRKRTITSK